MKKCTKCKKSKDEGDFNKKRGRRDGLSPHCKTCSRKATNKCYHKNPAYYKSMIYARRAEVVAIIQEKKSKTPCKDCGESYPYYCMDFDHLDGKLKDFVIGGSYNKKGKETILTEISKCDILCAICHRIRTHNRKLSMGT